MISITKIVHSEKICNLSMPKGDTGEIIVSVVNGDLQTGDTVVFKMGKQLDDIVLEKNVAEFSDNTALVKLLPQDTKKLACGTYFYVMKLIKADGDVDTFVEKSVFELGES